MPGTHCLHVHLIFLRLSCNKPLVVYLCGLGYIDDAYASAAQAKLLLGQGNQPSGNAAP